MIGAARASPAAIALTGRLESVDKLLTFLGVGYLCDPPEVQGLAHFVEHMLFMGTADHPRENGWSEFLASHGGEDNGETAAETTACYFDVHPAYLRAAPAPLHTDPGPATDAHASARPGVLLVNLGTPDAPTPAAVTRYLREFLSDPKVVDVPRWLWAFVLNVIVIPRRRRRVAEAYGLIWGRDGSPLLTHTRAMAEGLAARLGVVPVEVGMRYGNPSLTTAIDSLRARGVEEVVCVPLFPQASDTTTGTVQLALARAAARRPDAPALRVVPAFPDDPTYIEALAARVHEARGAAPVDRYVLSFHGLPERYVRNGDPYLEHCQRTARALAARLGLAEGEWEMAYQSRFGDEPWLQPYLDERLTQLAREGHRRVLVALPGFAADCLETLEEVGVGLARDFREAGGEELVVVPALNDHPAWIDALEGLVRGAAPSDSPTRLVSDTAPA